MLRIFRLFIVLLTSLLLLAAAGGDDVFPFGASPRQIFGLGPEATSVDVLRAYRRLQVRWSVDYAQSEYFARIYAVKLAEQPPGDERARAAAANQATYQELAQGRYADEIAARREYREKVIKAINEAYESLVRELGVAPLPPERVQGSEGRPAEPIDRAALLDSFPGWRSLAPFNPRLGPLITQYLEDASGRDVIDLLARLYSEDRKPKAVYHRELLALLDSELFLDTVLRSGPIDTWWKKILADFAQERPNLVGAIQAAMRAEFRPHLSWTQDVEALERLKFRRYREKVVARSLAITGYDVDCAQVITNHRR